MKTTLMIPDALYRCIKQRAGASQRSISDIVTEFLQAGLRAPPARRGVPAPLPRFDLGPARVDVAHREALERAMKPGE